MAGNSFGTQFRFTTFGESHGPQIGCIVDGVPAGLSLSEADIQPDLDRRKPGTSKFVTQRREGDEKPAHEDGRHEPKPPGSLRAGRARFPTTRLPQATART